MARFVLRSSLLLSLVATACLSLGQEVATATLQPSGEVRYQTTYWVHLAPPVATPVFNAPYSADEVESFGNGGTGPTWHLLRKIARDAQGRTMEEKTVPLGCQPVDNIRLTELFDAPSGWVYLLDPQAKVAHRYHPFLPGAKATETQTDQQVEVATAGSGQPVLRFTVQPPASNSGFQLPKTATLNVAAASLPPQDLGERLQEGLHVHGIRYRTPTVAEDGARHDVISEVWVSPELQVIVETKWPTGQGHDRTVHLTHLTRSEPNPALFQVPPGYRIQEETSDFPITVDSKATASR